MKTLNTTKLSQPLSLYPIAFTELWERFGFYAVQSFIILYLSTILHFTDHIAHQTMALFSALLYFTPLLGGYLASRFLGFRFCILVGITFFLAGNILCSLHSIGSLYWGLSLQVIGNGFFKPNNSSLLGEAYHTRDPRREPGFTLFYMIANFGSLIPPLIIASIIHYYGWHGGFAFAAAGFLLALFIFLYATPWVRDIGCPPHDSPLKNTAHRRTAIFTIVLLAITVLLILLIHTALLHPVLANHLVELLALTVILTVLAMLLRLPKHQRSGLLAAVILVTLSIFFWAFYFQIFSDIMLFNHRFVSHLLFGHRISTEWMSAYNPFFIILLSPLFGLLWLKLGQHNSNPSIPFKFCLALFVTSLFFLTLYVAVRFFSYNETIAAGWLILAVFFLTLGELLLSPIGLAMITLLTPKHLTGMMMGVWFSAFAFGGALSGKLADYAALDAHPSHPILVYQHAFLINGLLCVAIALIALALTPWLKRLIAAADPATQDASG